MKRMLCIAMALILAGGVSALAQSSGEDYTKALQKKGQERIRTFEEYIKKYPDTSAVFTKYAYYWVAVDYYNLKNYSEAVARAEKAFSVGMPEKSNEAMLFLILANSYGVKDSPKYNHAQALKYVDKAIEAARTAEEGSDILKRAEGLKKELSGSNAPPKKPTSNLDKIKLMYNQQKYDEAINFYNSLADGDKKNQDFLEVYALALFQMKRTDQAIEKINEAYGKTKRGLYASLLGQMYAEKAKRDKKLLDTAADLYTEAGLLYGKEGKSDLKNANLDFAKVQIGEKYDYNSRAAKVNASMKNLPKAVDNTKEIEKLQRERDKMQRDLDRKYSDMEPPEFETAKITEMDNKIQKLREGAIPKPSDPKLQAELDALIKDQQKIESEFKAVVEKARKKLGL